MASHFDAETFLRNLTHRPGVYRMLDEQDKILYVGKARDLKNRVSSYFGSKAHHPKTQALMEHTDRVEITVTRTEQEALLLEYNLIKEHKPRFNVLLRDDKSYPYIHVTTDQKFPRFSFHRGARKRSGKYFGPFPNAGSVRQTLSQLQKLFRVRQCEDSFFANRTRPCLQHQIKRCTAPCVGLVDETRYGQDVEHAILFLRGRNDAVIDGLAERMEHASLEHQYEGAARYRDQIAAIKRVQAQQSVSGIAGLDADALAVVEIGGIFCVGAILIRGGRVLGGRNFFPKAVHQTTAAEVIDAFLVQHYFSQEAPNEIIVNELPEETGVLAAALSTQYGHKVEIRSRVRGRRRRWLEMAEANARDAAGMRLASNAGVREQLEQLADVFRLDEVPARIECFDISHTGGEETVASCVVFGADGPIKSDYRRFNIKGIEPGDDYSAIAQTVTRRYTRVKKGEAPVPDLVLIDGGKGQLKVARSALEELQMTGFTVAGVAKGPGRKPGRETIYVGDRGEQLRLTPDSPALHLIQQIRDEAHRFAITGHRNRRSQARKSSVLEQIGGLGPKRRRELLRHFGGLQGIKRAGVDDLVRVPGISRKLAEKIYDRFHGGKPLAS